MSEIERQLRELDPSSVFPATPELADPVLARLAATPSSRRRPRARLLSRVRPAVTLALVLAGGGIALLAASPGARSAILDLLGLQGARIERGQARVERGGAPQVGREVSLATARQLAGFEIALPDSRRLGPLTRVGFDPSVAPGGQVSLAWELPRQAAGETDGGMVVLTQMRAGRVPGVAKTAPQDTRIQRVEVHGRPGYWLAGAPHQLELLDRRGDRRPGTARLARETLLWERGDLLLRLEGIASKAQALEIARSIPRGERR